jgi:hypothetical protein
MLMAAASRHDAVAAHHQKTFAAFVQAAWNDDVGRFRNFMSYGREVDAEGRGSEDSNGRALWALGRTARISQTPELRDWATALFDRAAGPLASLHSPRAQAFALLGACDLLAAQPDHRAARHLVERGAATLDGLLACAPRDWKWFENVLAYDNARLSQAMIEAGLALGDRGLTDKGLDTLAWLFGRQLSGSGYFPAGGVRHVRAPARGAAFSISSRWRRGPRLMRPRQRGKRRAIRRGRTMRRSPGCGSLARMTAAPCWRISTPAGAGTG